MLKKPSFFLVLTVYLLAGPFFESSAYAQKTPVAPLESTAQSVKADRQEQNADLERKIIEVQHDLSIQEEKSNLKIERLEAVIESQKNVIQGLEIQLKSIIDKPLTNGTTFEVWSGILLGSVAILVTVLGVGVALLSFIGYRELIVKGTRSASLVAAKQTKLEVEKFVAEGKLDTVIAEIINKIMYRGISPNATEDPTDDTNDE